MDKEMNNMRELSMDEMDKVAGGKDTVTINGQEIDEAGLNAIYMNMARVMGYDVAVNHFRETTGFVCQEMQTNSWSANSTDEDRMGAVLNHFWRVVYGKSQY